MKVINEFAVWQAIADCPKGRPWNEIADKSARAFQLGRTSELVALAKAALRKSMCEKWRIRLDGLLKDAE